jgi:hypothetical protein
LAQADSRDDFVHDPISHADYASDLTTRLLYLVEQVQKQRHRPKHLLEVDIPKSGLSVRPGNVLPIEEASILHAIIYLLAPKLDKKLSRGVYSYRLHPQWEKKAERGQSLFREIEIELPFLKSRTIRSISPIEAWYERWPAFEEDAKRAVRTKGYCYLTKTDISSYFENINLRTLHDLLRSLLRTEEEKLFQLLFRILNGWSRISVAGIPIGRGIPQGNDVSSFLGNTYLIPLDKSLDVFCRSRDAVWFRYVDDVKVYTHNEKDAREVVFVINETLRELHLNLQGSKTQILTGKNFEEEHNTELIDKVSCAVEGIGKIPHNASDRQQRIDAELRGISALCTPFTRGLPDSVRDMKGKHNRLFRRLLTAYGLAGRSRRGLFEAALSAIRELPDLRVLRSALTFMERMPYSMHDMIVDSLLRMVEQGDLFFPYQVGSVLESLVTLHPANSLAIASRVRKYAFGPGLSKSPNWLTAQKALEALMSFPYKEKYIPAIANRYCDHDHPLVRRAALVLLTRAPKKVVRSKLIQLLRHPDSQVCRLALFFQRLELDEDFSIKHIAGLRRGSNYDNGNVRRLSQLYAISTTESANIASALKKSLDKWENTQSVKLRWHYEQIRERLKDSSG